MKRITDILHEELMYVHIEPIYVRIYGLKYMFEYMYFIFARVSFLL